MLRHIVVEGVDGSGKSTLIRELANWRAADAGTPHFTLPGKRSSSSTGGPVADLDKWVEQDALVMPWRPPTIYDRHPLISEPIYGPICRNILPGRFNSPTWLGMYRARLAGYVLVIWCSPPLEEIVKNVTKSEQMAGVTENVIPLANAYRRTSMVWPGVQLRYDYTRTSITSVLSHIQTLFGGTSGNRAA